MEKKSGNQNLRKANKAKNDEFYTQLSDIEKELGHYKEHFKGKTIFCNCDDPEESNFWNYFALNFERLGLKKLVSTHYETEKPSYKLEIILDINEDGKINKLDIIRTNLKQNGDFRSDEAIEILKEADIIITNPPFSLFREYVAQLFEYDKKFLIMGNNNAITYKEIFKLLNVMYFVKNTDGSFEVLDGQQRTISICEFIDSKFSINYQYFHNLEEPEKEQILNYKLMIYFCEGNDKEKLDWFKTINIAGEKLTTQELRNAIYTGTWLTDAKRYFSKTNCPAYNMANDYLTGSPIRQDYLETIISWISKGNIEEYMAQNQLKPNANELWLYFQSVINWIKTIFPNYRKEMKGVNFGPLYNEFKNKEFDSKQLEEEIKKLMQDEDVTKKSGIYEYILTKKEKYLNIRAFTDKQKRETYEKQNGICTKCLNHFEINEMEADHITPWHEGGKTTSENCQILCKNCNRVKSGK